MIHIYLTKWTAPLSKFSTAQDVSTIKVIMEREGICPDAPLPSKRQGLSSNKKAATFCSSSDINSDLTCYKSKE